MSETRDRIDRVIVVGLDGLEPAIVDQMIAAGELPHLAALREHGGSSKVATTAPAQTPVAWSTFATGLNPGGHGIFDFVGRNPQTYALELALNRYEQLSPFRPPGVVNQRKGTPFWDHLGEHGISSTVIRCPCTYPPDPVNGRMLSGMGVPDLRGSFGTGTFYSTDTGIQSQEAEHVVSLAAPTSPDEVLETTLIGPRHPRSREDLHVRISVERRLDEGSILIRSPGDPREVIIRQGEWSEWVRVSYRLGLLQSVTGLVRFILVRSEADHLSFYASPVQFDPESPPFAISAPESYAADLSRTIGLYHTTGLPEDHAALANGRIDEASFLNQCDDLWRERESMFETELARFESGFLYCLFDMTDRIQHLFWRYRDAEHPANRDRPWFEDSANAIEDAYRRADAMVGRARAAADDRTLIIALSDHGFTTFRRGVNLNTWLFNNGWLALRDGALPENATSLPLEMIDWDRTRAYAIGLGGLYLNMKGREAQGIVDPEDADAHIIELEQMFQTLCDPTSETAPIRRTVPRASAYHGPYVEEAPDLLVYYSQGYRTSWGSSLGQVGDSVIEENTRLWAGDHIIDPELVPGVLYMNRRFQTKNPSLIDLAPTILESFQVPVPSNLEGRSLIR